jgi:flagellar assembly protein FliH
MALEKPIIKAQAAGSETFDYKPREIALEASSAAKTFVHDSSLRSPDFKISELVARQTGISQLESDAHRDKINAQVLARLAEIQQKAYAEGYDLGRIEGTEKAFQECKAELLERLGAIESLLKRIEDLKSQILIDNEAELVNLVFLTAKKMALRDLEANRGAVLEILKGVAAESQADERVIVRLNIEDLVFLESLKEKSGKHIDLLRRVKFAADDAVKPGGCLIETEYGSVDATVEERVDRTWQTLQSRIPQKTPGKKE